MEWVREQLDLSVTDHHLHLLWWRGARRDEEATCSAPGSYGHVITYFGPKQTRAVLSLDLQKAERFIRRSRSEQGTIVNTHVPPHLSHVSSIIMFVL